MEEEGRGAPRGLATCQGHAEEGAELGFEEGSGCKAGAQHSALNQSHWSRNNTSHLVATVPAPAPFPTCCPGREHLNLWLTPTGQKSSGYGLQPIAP